MARDGEKKRQTFLEIRKPRRSIAVADCGRLEIASRGAAFDSHRPTRAETGAPSKLNVGVSPLAKTNFPVLGLASVETDKEVRRAQKVTS